MRNPGGPFRSCCHELNVIEPNSIITITALQKKITGEVSRCRQLHPCQDTGSQHETLSRTSLDVFLLFLLFLFPLFSFLFFRTLIWCAGWLYEKKLGLTKQEQLTGRTKRQFRLKGLTNRKRKLWFAESVSTGKLLFLLTKIATLYSVVVVSRSKNCSSLKKWMCR